MSTDEQRVRTMCGWVGVEISKSRKRKVDDPEFGMYRVRGQQIVRRQLSTPAETTISEPYWAGAAWTPYAFTLAEIEVEVETAISVGIPAAPSDLWLRPADGGSPVGVTTRWTSNYRGRRDLGVRGGELKWGVKTEAACGLSMRVWNGMSTAEQQDHGMAQMLDRNYLRNRMAAQTPKQRQREFNTAFQAAHLERRKYGLRKRHAAKLKYFRGTQ